MPPSFLPPTSSFAVWYHASRTELGRIKLVDVVTPTRDGTEIYRRCVTRPGDHQAILLQRLGLNLPSHVPLTDDKTNEA